MFLQVTHTHRTTKPRLIKAIKVCAKLNKKLCNDRPRDTHHNSLYLFHIPPSPLTEIGYANGIKNANQDFEVTFNLAHIHKYVSVQLSVFFTWPGLLFVFSHSIYLFIYKNYSCVCGCVWAGGTGGGKCGHSSKSFAIFHWDFKIIFMHSCDAQHKQNFDFGLLTSM